MEAVTVICGDVNGRWYAVQGWSTETPGIAVVWYTPATAEPAWSIIHTASGLRVGASADPETAMHVAALLGPLADWTLNAIDLLPTLDTDALAAAIGPALDLPDRRVPIG